MQARLHQLIVLVSDMDRSAAFYRDVLGLTPATESEWWSEYDAGGVTIALHPGPRPDVSGVRNGTDAGTTHIAFVVPDIEAACAELRAKGVAVEGPSLLEGMELLTATFADPDGVSLGLEQRSSGVAIASA